MESSKRLSAQRIETMRYGNGGVDGRRPGRSDCSVATQEVVLVVMIAVACEVLVKYTHSNEHAWHESRALGSVLLQRPFVITLAACNSFAPFSGNNHFFQDGPDSWL